MEAEDKKINFSEQFVTIMNQLVEKYPYIGKRLFLNTYTIDDPNFNIEVFAGNIEGTDKQMISPLGIINGVLYAIKQPLIVAYENQDNGTVEKFGIPTPKQLTQLFTEDETKKSS